MYVMPNAINRCKMIMPSSLDITNWHYATFKTLTKINNISVDPVQLINKMLTKREI
jgi:hypothetical protein